MKNLFINPVESGRVESFLTQGVVARAFTMAEILLSLTIIGVVAAITLPSLMGNINERTWNTQRKALHARMSQAIGMMPQLNGYGTSEENAAEAFITEGVSKVIKINNICDAFHLADCGIADNLTAMNGSVVYSTSPMALYSIGTVWYPRYDGGFGRTALNAAFETQNGESVLVMYNKGCGSAIENSSTFFNIDNLVCANFIYDLNGNKGPNTVGKDVGAITALYATDSLVVAPMLSSAQQYSADDWYAAGSACTSADSTTRMPNYEEAISLEVNISLFCGPECYFTASVPSSTTAFGNPDRYYKITSGEPYINTTASLKSGSLSGIYCIKR